MYCQKCGNNIGENANFCAVCGEKTNFNSINNNFNSYQKFNGVYRYGIFGKKEVYCPKCKSSNCSHYQEQKIIPGKSKKKTSLNLNPLKPFTVFNHKEKVIKQEQLVTESKFLCNNCGKIFY